MTAAIFSCLRCQTLLYGLHQRVSPQPWVYLAPNNSFRLSDIEQVDTTIVKSLKRNNVRVFVWETPTLNGDSEQLMNGMPSLARMASQPILKSKRNSASMKYWSLRNGR
jgi:hypothetical protein